MLKTTNERWKIGYNLVAPVGFNFKGNARLDGQFAIVDQEESPGEETFVGGGNKTSRLSEIVVAIGIGRRINENWSVGITNMFGLRSNHYNQLLLTHLILNDEANNVVQSSVFQQVSYNHLRYAARLGMAYRNGKWGAGRDILLS